MDASFDPYASYSDNSAPHTPESRPSDMHFYKPSVDDTVRIFADHSDDPHVEVHPVHEGAYWASQSTPMPNNFFNGNNGSRTSLLQELYNEEPQQANSDVYPDQSANSDNWSLNHNQQQPQIQAVQQQLSTRPHDYHMIRRNTFPVVRYDREDGMPIQQYPPFMQQQSHYTRSDSLYSEQLPLTAEPASLPSENFIPAAYNDIHDSTNIKLEDSSSMMVPSHPFYRPQSSGGVPPMTMPYMAPHNGLHVQHTDDAASKETQYLRRRCFNCHTTEPPSWRRSTLNPGKIVCNKCGLYERTHLRPRPLRFDELRAGNKQRKASKGTVSPKAKVASIVKKEPRENFNGLVRRASVSSNGSVHSGSGASDWDDNGSRLLTRSGSVYSSGSAPPTSFNSPNVQTFPLSRDSQSPPHDGGIRLPNAPLSDIASLQQQPQQALPSQPSTPSLSPPTKSHTSPGYFSPPLAAASPNATRVQSPEYFRRATQDASPGAWADLALKDAPTSLLSSPIPTPVAS
ncbi:Zinc finger transcription factor Trps1 [Leucoagaricus sp. SymC.cos]|nr:Zinc finger transcription factor Trps1 [Leucoagaricus sp. SymC.cos]